MRREQHRAGDDQRVLVFLADALPVGGVGEQALVRLEIFFVLDILRQRQRPRSVAAPCGRRGFARRRSPRRASAGAPAPCSGPARLRSAAGRRRRSPCSDDLVRSWLRSRRTVSWFASTSSVPPATKPATSTRWNADDIQLRLDRRLDRDLVVVRRRTPARWPRRSDGDERRARAYCCLCRAVAVIDFLEQLVVLPDLRVVRLELERLLVRLARLVELALVLVRDRRDR